MPHACVCASASPRCARVLVRMSDEGGARWIRMTDDDGTVYYYNTETEASVWEKPDDFVEPELTGDDALVRTLPRSWHLPSPSYLSPHRVVILCAGVRARGLLPSCVLGDRHATPMR